MLSNSSKYALKAVLYLALNSDESNKLMVKDVARSIKVPQAYIAKLLQELSRRGVVSSTRGPKGGFYLNEDNLKRPLIDIIIPIDGEKRIHIGYYKMWEDAVNARNEAEIKYFGEFRKIFAR